MSIVVNPTPILINQTVFPLSVPDDQHDWTLIKTNFFEPDWTITATNPNGADVEWIDVRFATIQFFGFDDGIWDNLGPLIVDQFISLGQGGTPLAYRIWRSVEFQVSVPQQICVPEWGVLGGIFGGDGCFDVPVIGGDTLVTTFVYSMQLIYMGSPAAIELTGSITAILIVIGIFVALYLMGTGTIHFPPEVFHTINNLTPGGTAGSITTALLVGGAVIGLLLVLSPSLGKGLEATGRYLPFPTVPRPANINLPSIGGSGAPGVPRTQPSSTRRSRR